LVVFGIIITNGSLIVNFLKQLELAQSTSIIRTHPLLCLMICICLVIHNTPRVGREGKGALPKIRGPWKVEPSMNMVLVTPSPKGIPTC